MKSNLFYQASVLVVLLTATAIAETRYVDANSSNPTPPYTTWTTAATTIQAAVDAALPSDEVLVTNGLYQTGSTTSSSGASRVDVFLPITVRSVNGPAVTIIEGYRAPDTTNDANSVRCARLTAGATLSGFTLTNGCCNYVGGGILALSATATVSNCVITGNSAKSYGGGGYYGTYYNCIINGNSAGISGGGVHGAALGRLNNCLVVSNSASASGGGTHSASLTNCTVVGNYGGTTGGGGVWGGPLWNCIVYYNSIGAAVPDGTNTLSASVYYCCTTPFPGGPGAVVTPPAFANAAGADFRLHPSSPCINAGNNASVSSSIDLEGNPRLLFGAVDMGAYEFQAPVHYVKTANPAALSPYTNWVTAATNIQDAVDAAMAGAFIVVSNGTYQTGGRAVSGSQTNRVVLTNAVTLASVNGAQATTIVGGFKTRSVFVGSNSVISGFTVTNGQTDFSGAGIWCDAGGAVSDCLVTGNRTLSARSWGGGVCGGTVSNCTLTNNYADLGGGAALAALFNCVIASNSAPYTISGTGGGLYQSTASNCTLVGNGWGSGAYQSTLYNCTLLSNFSAYTAGGAEACILSNCTLVGNRGWTGGTYECTNYNCTFSKNSGGSGGATRSGISYNCLLVSNTASSFGGGAYQGTLYGCTIVGNVATNTGGGVYGATLYNAIVYYNSAPSGPNWYESPMTSCCTPLGVLASAPLFVDLAAGDLRLQPSSPCINSGNNTYATNQTDLDGNPRIIADTVDVGAYEFQTPASAISYAWLQQYGLPINGSTDSADADGDGMSNWQEWRCATTPTNPLSVLKLLSPSNSLSGITVSWQSVSSRTYFLQRSTDLGAQPPFIPLATNIPGQPGTTSYTDTTAVGPGPFFYRVGIQP